MARKKKPQKQSYVWQPRVFVTLNPADFSLAVELPGVAGRRVIPVSDLQTIRTILMDQQRAYEAEKRACQIGEDGAPTERQLQHWEDHNRRSMAQKAYSTCPFCKAEAQQEANFPTKQYDSRGKLQPKKINPLSIGL